MCRYAFALLTMSFSLDVGASEKHHIAIGVDKKAMPAATGLRDEDIGITTSEPSEVSPSLAQTSAELRLQRGREKRAAEWRAATAQWNARLDSLMQTLGFATVNSTGRAHGDAATDTMEVPYYFFNFPLSIKFLGTTSKTSSMILMDKFKLFDVPTEVVYIYPIALFIVYTLVWCVCCMRSNRTGLSFRVICEAATCFMCLWADLATKHKVITATRAWSYIVVMITLLTAWNVATIVTHGSGSEDLIFYTFQALVVVAWLMYGAERMFVRKYYRRTVDPMAGDHYCADCAANICCGQFTALQEAQFMAEVSVEDTLGKSGKSGGKDKW